MPDIFDVDNYLITAKDNQRARGASRFILHSSGFDRFYLFNDDDGRKMDWFALGMGRQEKGL